MVLMTNLIFKIKKTPPRIIIILLVSLICFLPLLRSGFIWGHDIRWEIIRVAEYARIIREGVFPVRWGGNLFFGYGYPIYNFFPPLFLTVTSILHIIGLPIELAIKLVLFCIFFLSGYGFNKFARNFYPEKAAILAGCCYIFSFYFLFNIHIRDAFSESMALTIIPFIFDSYYKLIAKKRNNTKQALKCSILLSLLVLSHIISTIIYIPILAMFIIITITTYKKWNAIKAIIFSGGLSFLLTAFFTLPILLERKYISLNLLKADIFTYSNHFKTLWDLVFRVDQFIYISVFPIIIIAITLLYLRVTKNKIKRSLDTFFIGIVVFATFMITPQSRFIWDNLSFLHFLQFPWRFLSVVNFGVAFLSGYLWYFHKLFKFKKFIHYFIIIYSFVIIIYLHPFYKYLSVSDEYISPKSIREAGHTTSTNEYLPRDTNASEYRAFKLLVRNSNNLDITYIRDNNNIKEFIIKSDDEKSISLNLFNFPGWKVYINKQEVEILKDRFHLIKFNIKKGKSIVKVVFQNTFIRKTGNILSIIGLVFLICICASIPVMKRPKR